MWCECRGRVYTSLYEVGEREVVMVLGAVDSATVSPKYHRGCVPDIVIMHIAHILAMFGSSLTTL